MYTFYFRPKNLQRFYPWALGLVIVLHAVGFFGWHSSWAPFMSLLTDLHLLICFWILFEFSGASTTVRFRLLLVYALGLGVELLGVHSGYPFGVYTYLEGLGPQVWDVPWVIGVNWAILALATAQWVKGYLPEFNRWQRVLVAAVLMVLMDLLIEPVAPQLRFWIFAGGHGWLNSLGWLATSIVMQYLLADEVEGENRMALPILLSQAIFFAGFHLWPVA